MIKNIIIGVLAVIAILLAVNVSQAPVETLGNKTASFVDAVQGFKVNGVTVFDSGRQLNYLVSSETITVDDTLATAESGKTVYIGTAGVDLTLPLASTSVGLAYRVVVSANFATTNMTITGGAADASDDFMFGALEVAGAVVACSAEDTITFVSTAENPGDFVEFRSNGSSWFITGQATAVGGITCTDVD
jgi:hypothetical protein